MSKFNLLTKKIEKIALAASWQYSYVEENPTFGIETGIETIFLYLYLPPVVGRRESQA